MNDGFKEKVPQALRTVQELDDTYARLIRGDLSPLRKVPPGSPERVGEVGLSDAPISPLRSLRGSKGINPRQRDLLCWSAAAIERCYGKANLSFLTFTLPDLLPEHLEAVKANWSDIVHRVQLRIKDKLNEQNVTTSIAGCVELQLERYENSGSLYPHLHLVFRGRGDSGSGWAIQPHQFRQIWRRCVGKFIPAALYNWSACENVQRVEKSVAGYLAKYISKCASKAAPGLLSAWHPRDWIFVGRRLRSLYESMSLIGTHISDALDSVIREWKPGYGYVNGVYISTPAYGERRIGYVGWLKGEERYPTYAELHITDNVVRSLVP